jgi:hypothetical protein
MAGDLYHSVGRWAAKPWSRWEEAMRKTKITEGRVSHVFFFPKDSFQILQGKKKRWAANTAWGRLPDIETLPVA